MWLNYMCIPWIESKLWVSILCKRILSSLHNQMHSKVMKHEYITQKSTTHLRNVLIDPSIKRNLQQMDKQYTNILQAPKPDMELVNN